MKKKTTKQPSTKQKAPKYTPTLFLWQFSHQQHGHMLPAHALPTNNAVRAYKYHGDAHLWCRAHSHFLFPGLISRCRTNLQGWKGTPRLLQPTAVTWQHHLFRKPNNAESFSCTSRNQMASFDLENLLSLHVCLSPHIFLSLFMYCSTNFLGSLLIWNYAK